MTIKPIETLYRGHYFRSKAEARFAVFLDCLGVKWEYEPQGFDLGNGLKYLPDFKIYNVEIWDENRDKCNYDTYEPKMLDIWVEVKGMWKDDKPGELSDFDYAKIKSFVFDKSGSVINPLWVAGNCYTLDPRNKQDFLSCADHGPQNLINTFKTITGDNKDLYPVCPQYGKLVLAITDCDYPVPYGGSAYVLGSKGEYIIWDNILNALEEAGRYKFDHGGQYEKASCAIHDHIAEWSDFIVESTRLVVCGMLEDIKEAVSGDLVDEILQKYSVKTVDDVPYCDTDTVHLIYKDACKIVDDYCVILSER